MIRRRGFMIGAGVSLGAAVASLLPLGEALAAPRGGSELDAILAELQRGVAKLRLPDSPAPYTATLRMVRATSLTLDGSYGGVIVDMLSHEGIASVGVRVGSHERDNGNFFGGNVEPSFRLARSPDPEATGKRLWLTMDSSYRAACAAYKAKLSAIDRLADKDLPDDWTPLPATVVDLSWAPKPSPDAPEAEAEAAPLSLPDPPLAAPAFDRAGLRKLAGELSARFREHPSIDNGDVIIQVMRTAELSLSSDPAVVGREADRAVLGVVAQTQAEDGMELDHGLAIHLQTLPSAADLRERGTALVDQVLRELEELVAAPMLDDDYDGPVLFGPTAAAQLLASIIPIHAGGDPAPLSDYGRLRELEPHWQESLGKMVMPESLDLIDDPLLADGFGRMTRDAEGVAAQRVAIVEAGTLHSLLMTRRPNEHQHESNGHARATPGGFVGPCITNLMLTSRKRGMSPARLERELLVRAREDGYDYAFVIESLRDGSVLGPVPRDSAAVFTTGRKISMPLPSRVFRVEKKGNELVRTLVRGALLEPISMRVLRRIRAVGDRSETLPMRVAPGFAGGFGADLGLDGLLGQSVDVQVSTPALLVDGAELVVERGEPERLPILDHPLRRSND